MPSFDFDELVKQQSEPQEDLFDTAVRGGGLSSYRPRDIRSPEQSGISAASKQIGKPVDDRGDFMRGLGNYIPQMRDMGRDIQTVAGVGLKKLGATDIGQSMIEAGIAGSDAAEADIIGKDTDEFTTALDKGVMNVLTDWLPYQAGQAVGMAGEMALAVGAGALLGSAVGGPAGTAGGAATGLIGKAFIKKGLKEQASKIAEEYGEEAAQNFLKKQTGKAIGKDIAITGAAEFHGMGEVGGRMLDQLDEEGKSPDDLDFARFALASQGHAALERMSDMIAIKSLTRKLDAALDGNFFKAVAGRGMLTGAKEAPVEMGQTLLERYGAALPVDDQEAFHEYFNAAAAGFAMGGMMGGVGGGVQALSDKGKKDPTIKPGTEFTPEEQDTIASMEAILSDPNTPTEEKVKAADFLRETKANAEARTARSGPAQLGGTLGIDALKAEFDETAAWGATTWKQNSPTPAEPESEINPPTASFDEYVQEFEQAEAGQVAGQVEKDTGQVEKDALDTGKIETDQAIAEADQVADDGFVEEEYTVEHYYDDDGNITDADGNILNDEQIAQAEAEYLKDEQTSQPDALETKGISSPTKSVLYDENDKEHNVTYQVVEASDLEGSVNKDVNQFRDRDRKALRLAVEKIANNPLFDKVGVSSVMETGAPVVASDGKIVAGNGRFLGLSEAYGKGTSGAYTDGLISVAESLGIDPASVQGMKNPVLIRRLDPDADTQNLAILSNEGGAAPMSALEQSTVDAQRIGELPADIETRADGRLTEAARNGIARRLIAGMPQNQANALVDENGRLSQEGEKRLDNAILNMAYGESSVLTRLTESREQNLQNLSQALIEAAPRIANMRNSIEGGVLFDADPVPYIVAAVEAMTAIRNTGQSVEEFVAQTDAFTEIAPETESVLKFFDQNVRNKKAMRDFMVNYTEQLATYGDPSQESMFERPEPTTQDVIENAKAETDTGTKEGAGDVKEGSRPDATDGRGNQEDEQREEGQADLLAEPEPTGETIAGYALEEDPDYTGSHRGGWITRGDGKKIRAIFGTGDVQWGRDKSGAYVVDQLDRQKTGKKSHDEAKFDEHVLLMGFDTQAKAKTAYLESMPETDGKKWNGYTYITKFKRKSSYEDDDIATFVEGLDLTKPWREYTDIPTRTKQGENATMEGIKAQKAKEKELDKSGGWDDIVDHWSSLLDMPKKVTRPEVTEEILPAEAKDIIDSWKEEAARQGKENKTNGNKIVLSLFDRSGVWAQPWADAGYDVRTIDLETDKVDVMDMDRDWFEDMGLENVHVVLAACPCTHFASTAAMDWKEQDSSRVKGGKDNTGVTEEMIELTNQTMEIISYLQPAIYSIENPKGRIWKVTDVPGRPTLVFQPNNYGDPYTKETFLYGKFNPDLPTANVFPTEGSKMQSKLSSKDEKERGARSETPEGFAYAFFMANNDEANPGYLQLANEYVDAMPKKTSEKDRDRARSAYIVGIHQENLTWNPESDSVPKFVEEAYDQGRIDSDEEWRAEQVLTEEQLKDHINTAVDRQDATQHENDVKLLGKTLARWMGDVSYETAVNPAPMPDSVSGIQAAYKAAFDRRLVTYTPQENADFFNGVRIGENPGVLYVSSKSNISLPQVFGHELYHDIAKESPAIHGWLKERLLETVQVKGLDVYSLESYQQALIVGHEAAGSSAVIDTDHVMEELLADSLGDALADPKFLQQLVDDNPGKFKKLLQFVTDWLAKVSSKVVGHGSEKYFKDIQTFRGHLRHALNAHAQGKSIVTSVPAPKFNVAWHGTPHEVDKFSTDNIGTGEGAQAYGWGLYFAGKREVAEWYKDKLSTKFSYRGEETPMVHFFDIAFRKVESGELTVNQAVSGMVASYLTTATPSDVKSAKTELLNKFRARYNSSDVMEWVDSIKRVDVNGFQSLGNLYEVDLAPKEDEYLLWDKPLSEQSEKVKKALQNVDRNIIDSANMQAKYPKARELYYEFQNIDSTGIKSDKATSEYLHSLGIRGIKYLDGSSRGKGDGNYNYVIFDEQDVSITGKFSIKKSPLQVRVEASGGAKKDLTVKSKYEPKVKGKQISADIKPHLADQHEARLNEIQAQHPRPLSGQAAWEKFMVEVYGTSDVPPAPFQALKYAKDPTVLADEMGKINEKQKQMANEGLALTKKIRQLYDDGDADPAFTAKLFMWSYMSKSATAYHHEAGFLEMVMGGVDEHLDAAAEGNFDPAAYKAWANSLSLKDRSVAASVTSNVNDFGETFLQKLNVKNDEGVTGLKRLHDMISDRNITSKTIRREFFKLGEKLGIDNKVVSFTLLMSGREDVMVIDRIQARHLWDHPGFSFIKNLYEGDTKDNPEYIAWKKGGKKGKAPAKKVVVNPGLAGVLNGYRGLALYEAIESELMNSIDKAYSLLGRKEAGTVGRWHWESWVLRSGQEVGHGTIDGLVREYGGEGLDAYSEITSREGRYHQFAFGHEYSPANGGTRFVTDSAGKRFEFDLDSYNALMKEVKRQSKTKVSVTKAGFSVAAQKEEPWYNHPDVNRKYLDEVISTHGKESRKETTDKQGIQEEAAKRPAEAAVQAADPSTVEQEYNSAKTSRNQVPALFHKLGKHLIETGGRNVDIGGGAWEKGTELLKTKYQMDSRVLDRFNRTEEHNQAVQDWIDNNPTDTATIANVLNVIKEPEIRQMVIQQGYDAVKTGGQVFISTYEKGGSGVGHTTKDGWQERRKTATYIPEIEAVFGKGNVKRYGDVIVATKTGSTPKFSIKQPQFYSELSKQVANISQQSAPAAQWKGMIKKLTQKGVKPAEMEFVDIDGFLDSQTGKVQKSDILRYLETNAVQLYSIEKNQDTYDTKYSDYVTDGYYTNYQETLLQLPTDDTYRATAVIYSEDTDANDEILTDLSAEGMLHLDYGRKDVTLYFVADKKSGTPSNPAVTRAEAEDTLKTMEELHPGQYEIVEKEHEVIEIQNFTSAQFRVVKRSVSTVDDSFFISVKETGEEPKEDSEYDSVHWEENNVAVHMRSTDRQFGGEDIFVIEEIQSDWSQEGRKWGYKTDYSNMDDWEMKTEALPGGADLYKYTHKPTGNTESFREGELDWISGHEGELLTKEYFGSLMQFIGDMATYNRGVPHTPFKKTDQWALLGFKKMLMKAVEQGADRIAWIPGDLQADRYNLAEQVDVITVDNRGGDSYDLVAIAARGDAVLLDEQNITISRIESLIGKEFAAKVSEQKEFESVEYEGDDLKLGGEGMKGFYDKMLPSIVGKFVKKFGAKVEVSKIRIQDEGLIPNTWSGGLPDGADPSTIGLKEITWDEALEIVYKGKSEQVIYGTPGERGMNTSAVRDGLSVVLFSKVFRQRGGNRYFTPLVTEVDKDAGTADVWSVKINDKMKEATNNGMPLFSIKPAQTLAEFQEEQENSEPFKEWSENAEVIEAEDVNDFKYVPGKPYVLKLNHGTTHEFWSFNSNVKGSKEGYFGAVNYFTSDEMDASENYGSYESPDAMLRRDVLQDRIMGDLVDMPEEYGYSYEEIEAMEEQEISELARDIATDQIMGDTEKTMQLYVKTVKPFVIGGDDSSWVSLFDHDAIIDEARETVADNNSVTVQEVIDNPEEYEDELNEATYEAQENQESPIIEAIDTVADRYGVDPSSLIAEVYELSGGDEFRAQDFESTLRESDTLMYVEDPYTGDMVGSHVIAEIIQEMGYDSIIMKNADRKFTNMPMGQGTTHVHVFNENNTNIKSATENVGTFDPKNDDIRFNVKQTKTSEFRSWFGSSKIVDANGNPMIKYHGTVADFNEFTKGDIGYHVGTESQANYRLKSLNIVRGGKPGQTEAGANIMPLYVKAENPLRMSDVGEWENPIAIYEEEKELFDELSIKAGYEEGELEGQMNDAAEALDDLPDDQSFKDDTLEGKVAMEMLVDIIKRNGYDSIVYENYGEIAAGDNNYEDSYIVFDGNQLKSAAGNTGEFSESGDVRFSLGSMFRPKPVKPEQIAEIRSGIRDRMDKFRFSVQDKLIDLKRKQSGLPALPDYANPYQKAGIWEGKTAERMNDFDEASVQPLLEKMAESKMDVADIGEWLVARHAREANLYLYGINPQIDDFNRRSSLSGMKNEDADAILADPANVNNAALQEVGQMIDKINSDRVDMLVDEGLLTPEMAAKWRGRYKHYVPLKREEAEGNDLMPSRGQGFSLKGKESKMRTGSAYWTPHMIITNTLAQMESSMVRAGKNDVGKALLALVEQHPDDNFWGVAVDQKQKYVRNGKVVEGPKMWDSPNEVTVKKDGKDFVIIFNAENEKAMRLAAGMKNLNAPQLNGVVGAMGKISRFLSHINTSWNPEFVISNFFRDYQTAGYNLSNTELKNASKQVLKDVPKAMAGIRSALFGDGNHAWAKEWEEFRRHGGKTGWIDLHSSLEKKERDLAEMVDRVRDGKPSVGRIRNIFNKIDDINAVVENGVRLAAYKNAIDKGLTPDAAAALAKDLTVNFNRKGNMGPMMNAMYMFYNASIQGSVRLLQTIVHSKRGRIMAGATIGFAIMLDMLNRALADDDDDGENLYDALPNYVKAHNLIIMGQKEPIVKLPLPWGYNVLHTIGQSIGETITGQNAQPLELMTHVGLSIVDAFNPVGSGSPLQMIAPTVVDPFVQIAENKNFAGIPLKPEQMPFGAEKPLSQQYFSSAREMSKDAAAMMNSLTGGNEFRPGAVDVSPEWIDMIFDYFTGGAGRTALNSFDVVQRLVEGKPLETGKTPFVRKVTGYNQDHGIKSRYYEWSKSVAYSKKELKGLKGEEYAAAKMRPEAKLVSKYTQTEKVLRKLRSTRRRLVKSNASEKRIEAIDVKIRKHMASFNRAYATHVLNRGQ